MTSRVQTGTFALLLLALAGCGQSAPTKFYTLTPSTTTSSEQHAADSNVAVGMSEIILPDYLDRPEVVTRIGANQMQLDDFDSWVEPLESVIHRTMVRDIGVLLNSDRVVGLPDGRFEPIDYRVDVIVIRFDSGPEQNVTLEARWALVDDRSAELVTTRLSIIKEALTDPVSTEMRVAAMSAALGRLSREIAAAIAVAHTS
jgi:uncharacterized lipoprotein YmbA